MTVVLVALGSNRGDRRGNLDQAVEQLAARSGLRLIAASSWHATRAIGGPTGQDDFLNGAVLLDALLEPDELLTALEEIETEQGRQRDERWGPRTLDLDLLLYGERVIQSPRLVVPHPRMAYRRFVLEPAAEVAHSLRHPTIGWTIAELRDHLRSATAYVAIAGPIGAGKTALATAAAQAIGARLLADPLDESRRSEDLVGPTGPAWDREIELLCLREAQLARATWPADRTPAISDYWFEQSICFAELGLPADPLAEYVERWRGAAAKVVSPKLLVVLDAPDDVLWRRIGVRGRPLAPWLTVEWLAQLRQCLLERASPAGRGPVLRLDGANLNEAIDELSAAIGAMQ
jgi:2-amino-4-hydroxy-6-hydroxymethyldihydropteridine diphosphokinase